MTIKRELRYVVLKLNDVDNCLSTCEKQILGNICSKVEYYRSCVNKQPLNCLVVESDWPEYNTAWNSIVERMSS